MCATLLVVIAMLTMLHVTVNWCWQTQACGPLTNVINHGGHLFDLGTEGNVPTWFSTMQLGLVALALAVAAIRNKDAGGAKGRWWMLVLLFVYLSLDEATDLHGLWRKLAPGVSLQDEESGFD